MKTKFSTALLAILLTVNYSFSAINTISLSTSSSPECDTVAVTIVGTHFCPNDVITGITHTVAGAYISINVAVNFGICIPSSAPFSVVYYMAMNGTPTGSYTVQAYYVTTLSSSTAPLLVTSCCPSQAEAGSDTSLCNTNLFQLNANSPPSSATASWSIITGSGTLSSSTQPNATISNMSYGLNTLAWTIVDTGCTTIDTIVITNNEMPTTAVTEPDRTACEDTTTIWANAITIGKGRWKAHTAGVSLGNPTSPGCLTVMQNSGIYKYSWTMTNGTCSSSDTLIIDNISLDSATIITRSNFLLTSTIAPQYQWYVNGSALSGATGMSYTATTNGVFKVLASGSGCSTGEFSNEIEILNIGIDENEVFNEVTLSPNPTSGIVRLSGLTGNVEIVVYGVDMKEVMRTSTTNATVELDLTNSDNGLYFVQLSSSKGSSFRRLVLAR